MVETSLIKAVLQILLLAPATSIFAIYIAKSLMLEVLRRSVDSWNSWIGYAVKCAFCLMGWIAFVMTLTYKLPIFQYLFDASWLMWGVNIFSPINFLVSWFSLWGLATLCYAIMWPFLEKTAPKMRIRWSRH